MARSGYSTRTNLPLEAKPMPSPLSDAAKEAVALRAGDLLSQTYH